MVIITMITVFIIVIPKIVLVGLGVKLVDRILQYVGGSFKVCDVRILGTDRVLVAHDLRLKFLDLQTLSLNNSS